MKSMTESLLEEYGNEECSLLVNRSTIAQAHAEYAAAIEHAEMVEHAATVIDGYLAAMTEKAAELERRNAELVEALKEARKAIVKCCNAAVEQLRTVAPEMKWDDGDKTAAMYVAPIDAALAHTQETSK